MQINNIDQHGIQEQAAAAGFASPELYIRSLLARDAERLAVQEGMDAMAAGKHRPFETFDKEFRERNGLSPRS